MSFFETSALDSTGVKDAVFALTRDIKQRLEWTAFANSLKVTWNESNRSLFADCYR